MERIFFGDAGADASLGNFGGVPVDLAKRVDRAKSRRVSDRGPCFTSETSLSGITLGLFALLRRCLLPTFRENGAESSLHPFPKHLFRWWDAE